MKDTNDFDAAPNAPEVDDVALAPPPSQLRTLRHSSPMTHVLRDDHLAGLLEELEVLGALLLAPLRDRVLGDLFDVVLRVVRVADAAHFRP